VILSKHYDDIPGFMSVIEKLNTRPPLVTVKEINKLKSQLAEVYRGQRFLIQGGDCAELYENSNYFYISSQIQLLFKIGLLIKKMTRRPCLYVGRIAGQYAKPRSSHFEERDGIKLKSYFGDIVNSYSFSKDSRQFDPERMLHAYEHSKFALKVINQLKFSNDPFINENLDDFLKLYSMSSFREIPDFFCSHEALLLPYEEALSRHVKGNYYNLSTHYPWLGVRTLSMDSPHLDYIKNICNPIAIKIDAGITEEMLINLVSAINPKNEEGRLTLITRLGAEKVSSKLPELINTLKAHNKKVIWSCDPMHGNTQTTENGIKTRNVTDITQELILTFKIHEKYGSQLGGIHLELTHEHVTECVGGKRSPVKQEDLLNNYKTPVDPRLNKIQALDMIEQVILELGGFLSKNTSTEAIA
jgi:3-deoxy-7-phosphoheptulonate synthase